MDNKENQILADIVKELEQEPEQPIDEQQSEAKLQDNPDLVARVEAIEKKLAELEDMIKGKKPEEKKSEDKTEDKTGDKTEEKPEDFVEMQELATQLVNELPVEESIKKELNAMPLKARLKKISLYKAVVKNIIKKIPPQGTVKLSAKTTGDPYKESIDIALSELNRIEG